MNGSMFVFAILAGVVAQLFVIAGKIAAQKGNQVGTAWLYGVGLVLAITSLIFTWLGWLST